MLSNLFKKKKIPETPHYIEPQRLVRELLRENLNLLEVDMFYKDDPLFKMTKEEKIIYLKTFFDLYKDSKMIDRIKYHINRQAQKTLEHAQSGTEDLAGAMNINGMAFIMNDVERLANMYIKETTVPPEEPLDKFQIIPKVG